MLIQYRFPDNPVQVGVQEVYRLERDEPGRWVGQFKWDGWRRPLYFVNRKWELHAKHAEHAKEIVPQGLLDELDFFGQNMPDGTAFDAEWMGRRQTEHTNKRHWFVLFDLMYFEGKWMGDLPYDERYSMLAQIMAKEKTPNIEIARSFDVGLVKLFEESRKMLLTEGIVIKRRSSKYKGNRQGCVENGNWLKIKWRA